MEPVSKDRKTCLDCQHGKVDISHGGVRCVKHEKDVVQWFTTPKQCLNYEDQA